ncbi:MAG: hypothetical protein L0G48_12085 [Staphylococcus equorum]|nr:hypothetical protein [Lactococcus lactis]MDN5638880.1 hypothetical protein [Staphylococcus equorum]
MNTYTKIAFHYFRNLISVVGREQGLFISETIENPIYIACHDMKFFITQIENSIVIIHSQDEKNTSYSIDACLDLSSKNYKEAANKAREIFEQISVYYYELRNQ